jgi:YHS domain-containing protein
MAILLMLVVAGWAGGAISAENSVSQMGNRGPRDNHDHAIPIDVNGVAVNAGNVICPIMGTAVTVDSPNKVEYQGKVYNLCCDGCKDMFLKDPEAALKKLAELEAAANK